MNFWKRSISDSCLSACCIQDYLELTSKWAAEDRYAFTYIYFEGKNLVYLMCSDNSSVKPNHYWSCWHWRRRQSAQTNETNDQVRRHHSKAYSEHNLTSYIGRMREGGYLDQHFRLPWWVSLSDIYIPITIDHTHSEMNITRLQIAQPCCPLLAGPYSGCSHVLRTFSKGFYSVPATHTWLSWALRSPIHGSWSSPVELLPSFSSRLRACRSVRLSACTWIVLFLIPCYDCSGFRFPCPIIAGGSAGLCCRFPGTGQRVLWWIESFC